VASGVLELAAGDWRDRGSWRWVGLVLLMLTALLPAGLFAQPTVRINELQSSNSRTLSDEEGDFPDWIELWNYGAVPVNLGGFGLSDRVTNPFKWIFSPDTLLAPGEFLVVHASGKNRQPVLLPPLAPTEVEGLKVWLRADAVDPSDPGQVRVTGDSFSLRRWPDGSGHQQDVVQAAEPRQPRWIPGEMGGRPRVRFDGADDLLQIPRPTGTNEFTLLVVCQTGALHEVDPESRSGVGGVSGQRWLFGARHGGDLDAGVGISIGMNGLSVYEHGAGYMPALLAYVRPADPGLQLLALTYSGRQPSLDLHGLLVRTGLVSTRREIWSPVEIGAGAYGAFAGDLFEVLMFERALSLDERRGIARALADHYAVPLPLPRHTNFSLSAEGEQVVLTAADGTLVDQVTFGVIPRDVSYGRAPDNPASWYFYGNPTPGAVNGTEGAVEILSAPEFSHEGGFYQEAFELALQHSDPHVEVRYTLNGDEPDAQSPLYHQPLKIHSRAGTLNLLSAIPTAPGWKPPVGEVFKGWPVRMRAYKPGALPSGTISRTYWVHPLGPDRYTLPVVALISAPAHFFDPEIGIYVVGNAPGGNFFQRGPEWERPVHVEFYEADRRLALAQDGDVKIHGNTSQGFPIKGLDLDGTGGAGRDLFRHPFFPGRDRREFEHLLLRPSGHDHHLAFMRDEFQQALGAETGAETQASRLCVVFLNGEYWGLHYLKEKQDTAFVADYAGLAPDEVDYLEGYVTARAGEALHYDAMLALLASSDPALPDTYSRVEAMMEVPNYLDYKICEIFNYRWDIGNQRVWRPRTSEGRWRWLHFDNDVGWGGFWAEAPGWHYDMLEAVLTPDGRLHGHNNETTTFLLRRLMLNPMFRRDFLNRFADLLNTTFQPTNTLATVDRHFASLHPEMGEHIQRWQAPASLGAWRGQVEFLREYARRRPDVMWQQLVDRFQLAGTTRLTLDVQPQGAGTLALNTLNAVVAPAKDGPWQGTYFLGNPIRLVARSQPGYAFAGWLGLGGVTTHDVQLLLQGDWTLVARFEPELQISARLDARLASENRMILSLTAAPGSRWTMESSSDLATWSRGPELVADGNGDASTAVPVGTGPRMFIRVTRP
jgi:hypothetical protein